MKKWLKKITGIADLESAALDAIHRRELEETEIQRLQIEKKQAEEAAKLASKEEELAKLSPKDRATAKGDPWINVLDVKVNQENIRNGFFEMDWNEIFIKELIFNGYGTQQDPQEEIVDRWFRDIVYQMLDEEGLDTDRGAGYINVIPISKGKSEVS